MVLSNYQTILTNQSFYLLVGWRFEQSVEVFPELVLRDITVLTLFYFSLIILHTAAKGGSSLASLITPGDSDFIFDLVINIVSEGFNQ